MKRDHTTSAPRCKVGGRAMLILPIHPQDYGKIVLILGRCSSGAPEPFVHQPNPWEVRSLGSPLCGIESTTLLPGYTMEARCDDRRLMPLPDEDQVDALAVSKPERRRKPRKASIVGRA